jgi:hypothetical protein
MKCFTQMMRRGMALTLAFGSLMPAMDAAQAAEWPGKPVRILVGAPGCP